MKFFLKIKSKILQSKGRNYRLDLNLWEEHFVLFYFIHYYKYGIWKGRLYTHVRFKRCMNAIYLNSINCPSIHVGAQEFKEIYKSNKWIIPINKTLDLTKP